MQFFFFFLFGTIVGSFLNVVILRYNTGRSVAGRSACFSCQTKLRWFELLPVVSYLTLGGKCRTCRARISWQYPAVELLTGVIFLLTARQSFVPAGFSASAIGAVELGGFFLDLICFSLLMVILVYDLRHKIIPDAFVYGFIVTALLRIFFLFGGFEFSAEMLWHLAAGPILLLPFFLLWHFSKGRWLGLGDGKLVWGLGWFLGLAGGASAVLLAFWIGAAVALLSLALQALGRNKFFRRYALFGRGKRLTMKSELPFAPFLILGLWLVFLFEISPINQLLFVQ